MEPASSAKLNFSKLPGAPMATFWTSRRACWNSLRFCFLGCCLMSSVDVRCSSSLYLWIVFSFMLLRLSNVTRSSRSLLKQVLKLMFYLCKTIVFENKGTPRMDPKWTPKWGPKWTQNGAQTGTRNDPQMDPK